MYCVNCGVRLADSEKKCPLCGTEVYHPTLKREIAPPLYPSDPEAAEKINPRFVLILVSELFLLPILLCLMIDFRVTGGITWSGLVTGGVLVTYVCTVLPFFFRHPNPVIFVPCGFAAAGVYLLYIDLVSGGKWFLSLAFPILGGLALTVTAVVTLLRYLRRGKLYIFGGASIALGGLLFLLEFLICVTFSRPVSFVWSIYPFLALFLIGMMLILIAIIRPLREALKKMFFL